MEHTQYDNACDDVDTTLLTGHRCALYHTLTIGEIHYYYGGKCPSYDPPESMEFSPNHPTQLGCENHPGDHCFPALTDKEPELHEGPFGSFTGISDYLKKEPELFHRSQVLSRVDCRFMVTKNEMDFPVRCRLFIAALLPSKGAAKEPAGGWNMLPIYVGQQVEETDYSETLPTAKLVRITASKSCIVRLNGKSFSVHSKTKLE